MLITINGIGDKKATLYEYNNVVQTIRELVIFDLETTSQNTSEALILELAAIKGEQTFHRFVKTQIALPEDLYAFQHIIKADYDAACVPARDALEAFLEFAGDAPLCGHNIYNYDLPVLKRALDDAELEIPVGFQTAIDSLRWAQMRFPVPPDDLVGYSLGHWHHFITGKELEDAHLASADCRATRVLFEYLLHNPPEAQVLQLWSRFKLPESRFFEAQLLEDGALQELLKVEASVEWVNQSGGDFPALEALFPNWLHTAIQDGTLTLGQVNIALDELKLGNIPLGFTTSELESLRQMLMFMGSYREPQREMAVTVQNTLQGIQKYAMIQAPTGTGKTKA